MLNAVASAQASLIGPRIPRTPARSLPAPGSRLPHGDDVEPPVRRAYPAGHDPARQTDDDRGKERRPEAGHDESWKEIGHEFDHQPVDDEQEKPERQERNRQ